MYTVKAAAKLAGVSVRTLHHYDHVGLLVPSSVSDAGYRLYSDDDLARLQQILFYRELGFELKAIKDVLDRPDFDRLQALTSHRALLAGMQGRLEKLVATCDRTIAALQGGPPMEPKEMFDGFGDAQLAEYQKEAQQRWGDTDAWRQSQERTKHYGPADYQRLKEQSKAGFQAWGDLMASGAPPTSDEAIAMAEASRKFIDTTFYDCPPSMFRCLGSMYADDPRFAKNYDNVRPGLANYVRDAVHAYCDREEAAK